MTIHSRTTRILHGLGAILVLASLLSASTAQAQWWGGDREVVPPIAQSEIGTMVTALECDEFQAEMISALHDGFVDTYRQITTENRSRMRDVFTQARESGDWQSMGDSMRELGEEMRTAQKEVELSFVADVKSLLSEQQLMGWNRYERDKRRRAGIGLSPIFSGEAVDVAGLIEELELGENALQPIDPLLESYARDIDSLLSDRDRFSDEMNELDWRDEQEREKMGTVGESLLEKRLSTRDTNRTYVDAIASLLPADESELLRERFRELSFSNIYRDTEADGYFRSVRSLDSLTGGQREAVETIEATYRAQISDLNRQMADLQNNTETKLFVQAKSELNPMIRQMVGAFSARRERTPFEGIVAADILMDEDADKLRADFMTRRRAVVRSAVDQTYGVLSPDQQIDAPRVDVPEKSESEQMRDGIRERMSGMTRWLGGGGRRGRDN